MISTPSHMEISETSVAKCKLLAKSDRLRFVSTMEMIAAGNFEEDLIAAGNFTLKEVAALAAKDKVARAILTEARRLGNESRQILRENAADKRAIHGTREAMYSQGGKYLGDKTNYSDTMLSLMLKAHDPKYRESAASAMLGGGMVLSVNLGIARDPKPITLDAVEVTPALPEGAKPDVLPEKPEVA
jgi:hypothetical protein